MPTLTTDKIIAKLNSYFTDNQYVFWYDDKQEFKDIIDSIAQRLSSVKLYKAQANQQFKSKIDLLNDSEHKYLIKSQISLVSAALFSAVGILAISGLVSTGPGEIITHLTLCGAPNSARDFVRPSRPDLLAL